MTDFAGGMLERMLRNTRSVDDVVVAFETERLAARMMTAAEAVYMDGLHLDPEVMATIGGVRDLAASETWLTANLDHWTAHGFGQWMLDRDNVCVGRGGLRKIDVCVGEDLTEVGYVIGREHWGNGYATEATRAFIDIATGHYGLDQLGAITLKGNDASTRVLEKCGFIFERWVDHHVGPHKFLRFTAQT
jgi:RimJ/RimL family protein N-acetyltransferase